LGLKPLNLETVGGPGQVRLGESPVGKPVLRPILLEYRASSKIYVDELGGLTAEEQDCCREQAPPKAAPDRRRKIAQRWRGSFAATLQEFAERFEGV
jgi:hypothetical protein